MKISYREARIALLLLSAAPASLATDEGQGFAQMGQFCASVRDIPSIKAHGAKTKELFDLQGNANSAIAAYRQKCNAWMANPQQTEAVQELTAERGKAMGEIEKFKQAVSGWSPKNQKYVEGMTKLQHQACRDDLAHVQQYYSTQAPNKMAQDMRAACTADANNKIDPNAPVNRAAEAGSDIAGGDAAKAKKIEEALNRPGSRANRDLLAEADRRAQELGLPSPKNGPNDRICGESCAAVLRASSACSANAYSLECANAKSAAQATRKGVYGKVYSTVSQ